ncbi:MAG: Sb-PDE family phosphodiesterase [Planctomycetota bacterium]
MFVLIFIIEALVFAPLYAQNSNSDKNDRKIEFPDIHGHKTLKCDFHTHTVFSDGHVWPSIRVAEAVKDGLDAIAITDHLEYQPHEEDIPHKDRNRSYQVALEHVEEMEDEDKKIIVINGVEITREMPPGHANAIFVKDANKLLQDDPMKVFREAKKQGAFVFWNHPAWLDQRPDGIATLTDMHRKLIKEGLLHGVEVVNGRTYSDETLQIAIDHNLTIFGNSDIHDLIDWRVNIPEGQHRPVTLVFAKKKTVQALREALENQRTAVWFNNTLIGASEYLVPLIQASLKVKDINVFTEEEEEEQILVHSVEIENHSDADYILMNQSDYTFHNQADIITTKAHSTTKIQVKTLKEQPSFDLKFKILNALIAPKKHPTVNFKVNIKKIKEEE